MNSGINADEKRVGLYLRSSAFNCGSMNQYEYSQSIV